MIMKRLTSGLKAQLNSAQWQRLGENNSAQRQRLGQHNSAQWQRLGATCAQNKLRPERAN